MTIAEWLKSAQAALAESDCPDPAIDSRWIAEDVLGMRSAELRFEAHNALDEAQLKRLNALLRRRLAGEPVQYLLERADFMGLQFYVDKRVLIPRQDTETLVEAAIIALQGRKAPRVLDLCTGSGAIGISIATLEPDAEVTLTDVSTGAIEVAKRNAHALNAAVSIRHGDLFKAVNRERFDMIVSNPPYIPASELSELQREVQFEPMLALDGGADGLDFYRRIAESAAEHLLPGGCIYLEVGCGEAQAVLALLKTHLQPAEAGIIDDLNGIERVAWARI